MTVRRDNLRRAAAEGFINATDCADYLVKKGLPFRDAYTVVGKLVNSCLADKKTLETLTIEEYKALSPLFEDDVYDAIDLETCVAQRRTAGGPAPEAVRAQIESVRSFAEERA
jgi:argininosuccinate lyase